MSSSSIWPIDRTLSGSTTPGQSRPGSDRNEGVLSIRQRSSIAGTSPSDYLVSYPEHLLGCSGAHGVMITVLDNTKSSVVSITRSATTFEKGLNLSIIGQLLINSCADAALKLWYDTQFLNRKIMNFNHFYYTYRLTLSRIMFVLFG